MFHCNPSGVLASVGELGALVKFVTSGSGSVSGYSWHTNLALDCALDQLRSYLLSRAVAWLIRWRSVSSEGLTRVDQ